MNQRIFGSSLLSTCIALSACGGGGGTGGGGSTPPTVAAPPVISFGHIFPQGDATSAQGVAWDIVGVKTSLSGQSGANAGQLYDTLRVDVTFAQDISGALPLPGNHLQTGSQLGVNISFDTDNNPKSGSYDTCIVSSGIKPFEFGSDTGGESARFSDGNYAIYDALGAIYTGPSNPPEEAITSVSGHVFSQSFYLPALKVASGSSIPAIGLDVAAANGVSGVTDCVPLGNGELYTNHS